MWIWIGKDGEFIPGVPAGDLTDEEMDEFEEAQPGLKKCGKWRHSQPAEPAAKGGKG